MPDVHVVLHEKADLGDGPEIHHTFNNAGHVVDKQSGWLHIHDQAGTVASFPQHNVAGVIRVPAPIVSGELK